ncbi:DUF3558 domain-containing protein [Streptomyces sp. ODS28]|uniref:DUF3558 domain-containing protein n=1 Tax=Streptomyces sp. ODS28 TaxID=3136688 RepID=UPI0031EF087E
MAVPVLLVAGCSSDSGKGGEETSAPSASKSASPSPEPVKFKELPDSCRTLSKGTVKELVPGTGNPGGKRIGTGDTADSGTCLWSGLKKYDYRQLTVSLKRFDSDTSRGSGDKQAKDFYQQQMSEVQDNKDNTGLKQSKLSGVGEQATTLSYDAKKKDKKGSSEKYHEEYVLARNANVVLSVDYEGAGFEDGKTPSSADLKKGAEKAAKEAMKQVK